MLLILVVIILLIFLFRNDILRKEVKMCTDNEKSSCNKYV